MLHRGRWQALESSGCCGGRASRRSGLASLDQARPGECGPGIRFSQNANLSNRINLIPPVQSPLSKIFPFAPAPNHFYNLRIPSHLRGVSRSSRTLERDAVDAGALKDERRGRGRRSRVVLTPRRWCQVLEKQASCKFLGGDGGNKARSPGRARRKPLKPLRREGRIASAEPVCSCAFFAHFCTRDRGCSAHPAFPAPSDFKARNFTQTPGALRRGNAKSCLRQHSPVGSLPPCGGELERGVSTNSCACGSPPSLALPTRGEGTERAQRDARSHVCVSILQSALSPLVGESWRGGYLRTPAPAAYPPP